MSSKALFKGNIVNVKNVGKIQLLEFIKESLPFIEDSEKGNNKTIEMNGNIVITENWNKNNRKKELQLKYQKWLVKILESKTYKVNSNQFINITFIDDGKRTPGPKPKKKENSRIIDRFLKVDGKELF